MPRTLAKGLLVLLAFNSATCSFAPPSVGGAAESALSLSDITQRKSGSEYVALGDGRTSNSESKGFDKGEKGYHGLNEDRGHYDDRDSIQKGYDVGKHSSGQSQSVNQGNNEFKQHGSGDYKKGYHKSGFTNNYHKDESGNKASFYEDSDDERGHRGYDNRAGYYGKKADDAYRDGRYDGAFNGRNNGHQGFYDNGARHDNRQGHADGYDDSRYHDDRRNYLHDGSGRYYDRNGNEVYYRREQPYQQPYHSHAQYPQAPLVSGPLYSRDYLDAPPPRYISSEESYRGGRRFGYFPNRRDYHETEYYYPGRGRSYDDPYIGGGGGYRGGSYGSAHSRGYRKAYHQPLDAHYGYRRTY
ncbi:uncharacterized protein [Neodiprion pinetum]|uniref:uncharacterized protein isoform X1 n=1 Tax=Neodiprion pinetum TaxID=441929 RepID=UPI001EDDAA8D|nr:uncharacterized protein LOC124224981 isoform X1 [Neodiprion pinetum]